MLSINALEETYYSLKPISPRRAKINDLREKISQLKAEKELCVESPHMFNYAQIKEEIDIATAKVADLQKVSVVDEVKAQIAALCAKIDGLEAAKAAETHDLAQCEALQDAIAALKLRVLELEHLAIVETCTRMVEGLRESKAALERDKQACSTFEGCAHLQQQIDDLQSKISDLEELLATRHRLAASDEDEDEDEEEGPALPAPTTASALPTAAKIAATNSFERRREEKRQSELVGLLASLMPEIARLVARLRRPLASGPGDAAEHEAMVEGVAERLLETGAEELASLQADPDLLEAKVVAALGALTASRIAAHAVVDPQSPEGPTAARFDNLGPAVTTAAGHTPRRNVTGRKTISSPAASAKAGPTAARFDNLGPAVTTAAGHTPRRNVTDTQRRLQIINANKDVPAASARAAKCGLVFDERMCAHECVSGPHPEQPQRIRDIFAALQKRGIVQACERVPARAIRDAELQAVHQIRYLQHMTGFENRCREVLLTDEEAARHASRQWGFNSVFMNRSSIAAARLSCGGVVDLVSKVCDGTLRSGMAIVRPPGHHAETHSAMGFCIYNNVAVAAKMATEKFGAKKVLIVDWDVHHGNGTQHMFQDDPRVLFFSTHRYDEGYFYPGGADAGPQCVGEGAGRGFTVNVGWNTDYGNSERVSDSEYMLAWDSVLLPIAREWRPDLVIVSAGFDAARGDPLGGLGVTPLGFAHMTQGLMDVTRVPGRVVLALEGGYNLASISEAFAACAAVLLGEAPGALPSRPPMPLAVEAVEATLKAHRKFWKCLPPAKAAGAGAASSSEEEDSDSEEDNDKNRYV